jgi:hypothetical protein
MSLLHLDELGGLTLGGLVRAHREELSFAVASAAQIQALPWKHTETDIRLKGVVQPAWPFLIRFKGVEVIRIMGWTEGGGSCITSQVVEMNYGRGLVFTRSGSFYRAEWDENEPDLSTVMAFAAFFWMQYPDLAGYCDVPRAFF